LDDIIEYRRSLIKAFKQGDLAMNQDCKNCRRLEYNDWETSEKVTYLNFSSYPAPCNCKCFYCNVWNCKNNSYENCRDDIIVPKFLDILSELQSRDLLSENCEYQISPGEITIHPNKEQLLGVFPDLRYRIFTNAIVYDEKIAEILRGGKSEVFVSLDSGTRETYNRVKGLDCFEKVRENLKRYSENGRVFLKFIVFPGINDSDEDFAGFLDIVRNYGGNEFKLARDSREKDISEDVYLSAARFIGKAEAFDTVYNIVYFNLQEHEILKRYITGMLLP
jgi:MoaA/NifB/PqqE/SkfB family radical SAM enzyme